MSFAIEQFRATLSAHITDYLMAVAALLVAVAAILALAWMIRGLIRGYWKNRGTRVITCPETEEFEAVKLDARHAAATGLLGTAHFRLESCTRWPEREDCPQTCIQQIENSPTGCLLQAMLSGWYQAQKCTFCRRLFGEIHWFDHKPALLNREGRILEWEDVPPEQIPRVLSSHWPVCWDCKIVETFRTEHPDLVVERPRT
jgi:hypothetical protein